MKKLCLTTVIFVFLMFVSKGILGQTGQTQLDQLKLMEQFVGTWQMATGADTVIVEIQKQGKAFVENDYTIKNGQKNWGSIWTYGFSPDEGKFKIFAVQLTGDYLTLIASFTSEKKWVQEIVQSFNPEKVLMRGEFVFETPETATATSFNSEGVKTEEYKLIKIK
jgi:hypothetical protein